MSELPEREKTTREHGITYPWDKWQVCDLDRLLPAHLLWQINANLVSTVHHDERGIPAAPEVGKNVPRICHRVPGCLWIYSMYVLAPRARVLLTALLRSPRVANFFEGTRRHGAKLSGSVIDLMLWYRRTLGWPSWTR